VHNVEGSSTMQKTTLVEQKALVRSVQFAVLLPLVEPT
jgi:hypothetical protein